MTMLFQINQGSAGSQVGYMRENTPTGLNATDVYEQQRLARIEEGWRFFGGRHWSFNVRADGSHPVVANYIRAIVLKKATFFVGKGVTFDTPKALINVTKPVIDKVWEDNNQNALMLEQAITASVAGDMFWGVAYQAPTELELQENPRTRGRIRVRYIAPHTCFPVYDPLDRSRMQACTIVNEVLTRDPRNPQPGFARKTKYYEEYTRTSIRTWWEGQEPIVTTNRLGEVPIVKIRNEIFPNENYGLSDVDGLIDLQRELNEKMTDLSDIISYHAAPITIVVGASAKNLTKNSRTIWSLTNPMAKVTNLELNSDLPAINKHIDTLRTMMLELAGIPEFSLGKAGAISNTSAAALAVQFAPLLEAVERKEASFVTGMQEVNRLIIRMHQIMYGLSLPTDMCECCGGRIISTTEETSFGSREKLKCYVINPQTLEFMDPQDMPVGVKRKLGQGTEYRHMPFKQAKAQVQGGKKSYWNIEPPEPEPVAPPTPDPSEPTTPGAKPAAPAPALTAPPDMAEEQMDIPEEPEEIQVVTQYWDIATGQLVQKNSGKKLLVPTGCEHPKYLSPYKTLVKLKPALPRDREREANLHALYQNQGWASRDFIRERNPDFEGSLTEIDQQIADDIPLLQKLKTAPAAGVGQTAGVGGS